MRRCAVSHAHLANAGARCAPARAHRTDDFGACARECARGVAHHMASLTFSSHPRRAPQRFVYSSPMKRSSSPGDTNATFRGVIEHLGEGTYPEKGRREKVR